MLDDGDEDNTIAEAVFKWLIKRLEIKREILATVCNFARQMHARNRFLDV